MSERNYDLKVSCRMCRKTLTMKVRVEDYITFDSPGRPAIQNIFPYLSPEEREMLVSNICPDCWTKMFGGEDDE